jgi:ATP-dependent Zn protease
MKNLILFFILVCFLSSCTVSNSSVTISSVSINEQKELTTIEMQDVSRNNSQVYKVIQQNDIVYLINPNTNLVEKEIKATSSQLDSVLEFVLTVLLIIAFLL